MRVNVISRGCNTSEVVRTTCTIYLVLGLLRASLKTRGAMTVSEVKLSSNYPGQ